MTVSAIISHMEDLLSLHRTLLEWSELKRQAIIDNRVNELTQWVNKEMRIMKQVAHKQNEWRAAVSAFLVNKGIQPDASVTVSTIAGQLDHETDREKLTRLQQQLLDTITELKELNALNHQLIEQSLAYINYSIDLFSGGFAQEAVYRNPAHSGPQAKGGKRNARFDTRA